jgi:hypothetical protein
MHVLTDIPFEPDADRVLAQARVEADSDDAGDILALVERARAVARPKAAYAVCFIEERGEDTVRIGGQRFVSRMLVHNLEPVERVFAMVATCGAEMDREFSSDGDFLREFWWDILKSRALFAAEQAVQEHIRRRFRLGRTSTMRPGAGDTAVWPIEQQAPLFALLPGVSESLEVRLTDSFLMVPNKTVSGLLFPAEKDFRSCEVCRRTACPSRHAAFNPELWEVLQHD